MNTARQHPPIRQRSPWAEPVTLTRTNQPSETIKADIVPGRGSRYTAYIDDEVTVEPGDFITWKGRDYEVRSLKDWGDFVEASLVPVQ